MAFRHTSRTGRVLFESCIALTVISVLVLMTNAPGGTPVSADPGAPTIPYWVSIAPQLLGIGLTLRLPRRQPSMPVRVVNHARLRLTTWLLLGLYACFALGAALLPMQPEEYVLVKALLLMVLPAVLLLVVRGSVRIDARPGAWRWWAPLTVLAVWFVLTELVPWAPRYDPGDIDLGLLVTAALATAITASVGEELFYRRWLQTRVEAVLGPWAGIGVTSLLFALMHLGSHGTGNLWLDVARAIALQGTFGWFMGVLWWRYRNLTVVVLAHLITNGWGVVVYLLTRG